MRNCLGGKIFRVKETASSGAAAGNGERNFSTGSVYQINEPEWSCSLQGFHDDSIQHSFPKPHGINLHLYSKAGHLP